MTISEKMIHSCRIRKDTDSGTDDDFGNPDLARSEVRSEVPCHFDIDARELLDDETAGTGIRARYNLLVGPKIEIAEGYLVDEIAFEDGTLHSATYKVHKLFPMRKGPEGAHHTRAVLERLS